MNPTNAQLSNYRYVAMLFSVATRHVKSIRNRRVYNMTLGNKIAELRKEKGLTQEALANALGVSNQAVSKWEANQSCPDIQLLPQIADFFRVSVDSLFGREIVEEEKVVTCENHATGETEQKEARGEYDVPWEDDGKLRAVVFIGRKLVEAQDCTESKEVTFTYKGAALDIISSFGVNCDDVDGNVTAGGNVNCDDINGNIEAGGNVNCDEVNGSVQAGGNVTCDEVNGSVAAGGDIICDEVNSDEI